MTSPRDTAAAALVYLQRFVDRARSEERSALISALRPTAEDYAALFVPDAAPQAEAGYDAALWSSPVAVAWPIKPEQTQVRIRGAVTSDEIIAHAPSAAALPGGYVDIAARLKPGALWIAWEFVAPGASAGLYFDGLVPRPGDRWVWCPKPWRVLGRAAGS
jgi:hypothetical protein